MEVIQVYYVFVTMLITVEVEDSGKLIIKNKQTRILTDSVLLCVKVH